VTYLLIANNQHLIIAIDCITNLVLVADALHFDLVLAEPFAKLSGPIFDQRKRTNDECSLNGTHSSSRRQVTVLICKEEEVSVKASSFEGN
jgi:hypothetical protein